jgi:hypothetical protein
VEDGWSVGSSTTGFFDVQQAAGTPDVIAVQFAAVDRVIGPGGDGVDATTAQAAADAIASAPGLTVVERSGSRMSGLDGANIVVENTGAGHASIMDVLPGRLGIDPGRRLWISLFDTPDGVVAIMVGGSVARWDDALVAAEPVLESVVIGS